MLKKLDEIKQQAIEELGNITDKADLEALRVAKLGKKGVITGILKQMGSLSAEERPIVGQKANQIRGEIESLIKQKQAQLQQADQERKLAAETVDVTVPGKKPEIGHTHPLSIVLDEVKEIFSGMGFDVVEGP